MKTVWNPVEKIFRSLPYSMILLLVSHEIFCSSVHCELKYIKKSEASVLLKKCQSHERQEILRNYFKLKDIKNT